MLAPGGCHNPLSCTCLFLRSWQSWGRWRCGRCPYRSEEGLFPGHNREITWGWSLWRYGVGCQASGWAAEWLESKWANWFPHQGFNLSGVSSVPSCLKPFRPHSSCLIGKDRFWWGQACLRASPGWSVHEKYEKLYLIWKTGPDLCSLLFWVLCLSLLSGTVLKCHCI